MSENAKSGYINGSDMLLSAGGANIGHCTTHSTSYSSETKDRAVKPVATLKSGSEGKYKEKTVTGLSISIDFEGLRNYSETENGFKKLLDAWAKAEPIEVKSYERDGDASPYLVGKFIITSLQESNPAGDDATYSGTLENTGAPSVFAPSALTGESLSAASE